MYIYTHCKLLSVYCYCYYYELLLLIITFLLLITIVYEHILNNRLCRFLENLIEHVWTAAYLENRKGTDIASAVCCMKQDCAHQVVS